MPVKPLLGFAPDVDPASEGILTDCANIVPLTKGLAGAPSPVAANYPALAEAATGAAVARLLDGTKRLIAGTATKLYAANAGAWTDVSRVGNYTAGIRWRFDQFGNATIATNGSQVLQAAIGTGNFADIATAPKAEVIATASNFVLAFNTEDGTYGDSPDRWWCSALGDHTSWTPSAATQATTGRFVDTPGPIRAAARVGQDIVVFKESAMYLGRYVGPPLVWQWQLISDSIGANNQESVAVVDNTLFFFGLDDLYYFDGAAPRPIESPVRDWLFASLNRLYISSTIVQADRARSLIIFRYPSSASVGAIDSAIVHNIKTGHWGRWDQTIECAVNYIADSGITYDSLGTTYATYDDLPAISYDSPFWTATSSVIGAFKTDHKLYGFTGASTSSSLTTGMIGADDVVIDVNRVQIKFIVKPTTGSMTHKVAYASGDQTVDAASNITMSSSRFDTLQSANWHKFAFSFTGDVQLNAMTITDGFGGLE